MNGMEKEDLSAGRLLLIYWCNLVSQTHFKLVETNEKKLILFLYANSKYLSWDGTLINSSFSNANIGVEDEEKLLDDYFSEIVFIVCSSNWC